MPSSPGSIVKTISPIRSRPVRGREDTMNPKNEKQGAKRPSAVPGGTDAVGITGIHASRKCTEANESEHIENATAPWEVTI